jgi:hypothetical protein
MALAPTAAARLWLLGGGAVHAGRGATSAEAKAPARGVEAGPDVDAGLLLPLGPLRIVGDADRLWAVDGAAHREAPLDEGSLTLALDLGRNWTLHGSAEARSYQAPLVELGLGRFF